MSYKVITPKTEKILNLLIGEEFKAMQAYEAIANWCQNNGFLRAYDFFLDESKDEKGHAALLEKYILDMGCIPELGKIDAPVQDFDSLYDVIELYSTKSMREMKKTFKDLRDQQLAQQQQVSLLFVYKGKVIPDQHTVNQAVITCLQKFMKLYE
jgi:ferritin